MNITEFNKIVKDQLNYTEELLTSKGKEYAEHADRLEHFKRAASFLNTTPKEALLAYLSKHLISISDMCTSGNKYSNERWREKISDSLNYLLLLEAITIEENKEGTK